MGRLVFILLLAAIALPGCYNLDSDDYPKTEPKAQDLSGTYFATPETVDALRKRSDKVPDEISVTLSPDGKCQLVNIPQKWGDDAKSSDLGYATRNGEWKTTKNQNFWVINLSLLDAGPFPKTLNITSAGPRYYLSIVFGDPDQGHALVFAKR